MFKFSCAIRLETELCIWYESGKKIRIFRFDLKVLWYILILIWKFQITGFQIQGCHFKITPNLGFKEADLRCISVAFWFIYVTIYYAIVHNIVFLWRQISENHLSLTLCGHFETLSLSFPISCINDYSPRMRYW